MSFIPWFHLPSLVLKRVWQLCVAWEGILLGYCWVCPLGVLEAGTVLGCVSGLEVGKQGVSPYLPSLLGTRIDCEEWL